MRISVKKLRTIIKESLLFEEKCPLCGADGAYIGLNNVECPNPKCDRFEASMVPAKPARPKGSLNFGVWHDKDPRSIDFASLQALSPEAAAKMQATVSADGEDIDTVPIWVATDPSQTNEEELEDWMRDDWDNLKVEHEGKEYVLFYGTEDDEYGKMWHPGRGEWESYMF